MIRIKDAVDQDYKIDTTAPGRPYAYKGARFAPTHETWCFTELESELLEALEWALPIAEESIQRELDDGAVGMGSDLEIMRQARATIARARSQ